MAMEASILDQEGWDELVYQIDWSLRPYTLQRKVIDPNGDCQFAMFSDTGNRAGIPIPDADALRLQVTSYISAHPETFQELIEAEYNEETLQPVETIRFTY